MTIFKYYVQKDGSIIFPRVNLLCVCVCVRERERQRETERDRHRERVMWKCTYCGLLIKFYFIVPGMRCVGQFHNNSIILLTLSHKVHHCITWLVPASAPRLVYQRTWFVLFCLWDRAYKRTLAANRKPMWRQRISSFAIWVVLYHMSDAI